jgi:hypothetical protein
MDSIIVGFGHKARQGKDTAARVIKEVFGKDYDVKLYSFAQALKQEVDEIGPSELAFRFGIPLDPNPDMTDPFCKTQWGKQSRVLQVWGEYQRKQNSFYWVRKLRQQIDAENPQFAFITDVRHPNEFYFVKDRKGHTVKVSRKGYIDLSRDPNHISEIALDNFKFDYEISVEEGDLKTLREDAIFVFDAILQSYTPETPEIDASEIVAA